MGKKVAVEAGLSGVREALSARGYEVIPLEGARLDEVSCVVVTGQDEDFLNRQEAQTRAPVIDASGMTATQVAEEVSRRIA